MRRQIIRQIDETGRIVLPKPFREMLDLSVKDDVLISAENDTITVRKFTNSCAFCGKEHSIKFCGTLICEECARKIGRMAE